MVWKVFGRFDLCFEFQSSTKEHNTLKEPLLRLQYKNEQNKVWEIMAASWILVRLAIGSVPVTWSTWIKEHAHCFKSFLLPTPREYKLRAAHLSARSSSVSSCRLGQVVCRGSWEETADCWAPGGYPLQGRWQEIQGMQASLRELERKDNTRNFKYLSHRGSAWPFTALLRTKYWSPMADGTNLDYNSYNIIRKKYQCPNIQCTNVRFHHVNQT